MFFIFLWASPISSQTAGYPPVSERVRAFHRNEYEQNLIRFFLHPPSGHPLNFPIEKGVKEESGLDSFQRVSWKRWVKGRFDPYGPLRTDEMNSSGECIITPWPNNEKRLFLASGCPSGPPMLKKEIPTINLPEIGRASLFQVFW